MVFQPFNLGSSSINNQIKYVRHFEIARRDTNLYPIIAAETIKLFQQFKTCMLHLPFSTFFTAVERLNEPTISEED